MRNNKIIWLIAGILLFIFGIYLSVFQNEPHFYTFFSVGLLIFAILAYNEMSKKNIFNSWKTKEFVIFFFAVLIISVIIDKIGIALQYWRYPHFDSVYDEVLKYLFEWVVPLTAYMILFMTGKNIFSKLLFVLSAGIITEYINSFALSWQILKMPLLNYNFGVFNLGFVSVGYWLMALITYSIYSFVEWRRK